MAFNFGDKPFKHTLPNGYKPINSVPKEKIITNTNGQTTDVTLKPANNAPQAIIIEVSKLFYCDTMMKTNVNRLAVQRIGGANVRTN